MGTGGAKVLRQEQCWPPKSCERAGEGGVEGIRRRRVQRGGQGARGSLGALRRAVSLTGEIPLATACGEL